MRAFPFLVNQDASGQRLQPIDIQKPQYNEKWLQDMLYRNPEILPVAEIEPIFFPLIPIGQEVATKNGAIDNLFISHRGYLVLVETKLWRNPEAKREVVAQALDYGSSIAKWNYNDLNKVVRSYTKESQKTEMDLIDWVEHRCGPVEGGRDFFEDTTAKNLKFGRFLILIVSDRIRQPLIDMLNYYANKYPHLSTDIVLIDLRCYQWGAQKNNWPLLVLPSIVARTEIVERSVMQITLSRTGAYEIDVKPEKAGEEKKKRVSLTEDAFWELLKERSPANYDKARDIVDGYREKDGITIDPAEGSIIVRLTIPDTGDQVSLFFVTTKANLRVWTQTVNRQLAEAGFDVSLGESYAAQMRNIMKMPEERTELGRSIREVNIDKFKSAVDAFIQSVQLAKPNKD